MKRETLTLAFFVMDSSGAKGKKRPGGEASSSQLPEQSTFMRIALKLHYANRGESVAPKTGGGGSKGEEKRRGEIVVE